MPAVAPWSSRVASNFSTLQLARAWGGDMLVQSWCKLLIGWSVGDHAGVRLSVMGMSAYLSRKVALRKPEAERLQKSCVRFISRDFPQVVGKDWERYPGRFDKLNPPKVEGILGKGCVGVCQMMLGRGLPIGTGSPQHPRFPDAFKNCYTTLEGAQRQRDRMRSANECKSACAQIFGYRYHEKDVESGQTPRSEDTDGRINWNDSSPWNDPSRGVFDYGYFDEAFCGGRGAFWHADTASSDNGNVFISSPSRFASGGTRKTIYCVVCGGFASSSDFQGQLAK